jgi:hypothetical protein
VTDDTLGLVDRSVKRGVVGLGTVAVMADTQVRMVLEPEDEYPHDPGTASNYNESMYLNGFDLERELGAWFRIGNRVNEGHAEVSVCTYLPGGRVGFAYARPEISANDEMRAGGLHIEVVEPFAHLRVAYDGKVCLLDDPLQMADPRTAFREPIRWLQCRRITGGYASDHTFRQSRSISRGESVAFLFRYAVTPDMIEEGIDWWTDPRFKDIGEDAPFFASVLWAANYGVTTGYSDRTFRQGRPVTRGEFAAFLYRTAEATNPSSVPEEPGADSGFSDVTGRHPFATEIAWLRESGLTVGYSDGTFRAGRQISRGEVAGMLYRYHDGFVRRP